MSEPTPAWRLEDRANRLQGAQDVATHYRDTLLPPDAPEPPIGSAIAVVDHYRDGQTGLHGTYVRWSQLWGDSAVDDDISGWHAWEMLRSADGRNHNAKREPDDPQYAIGPPDIYLIGAAGTPVDARVAALLDDWIADAETRTPADPAEADGWRKAIAHARLRVGYLLFDSIAIDSVGKLDSTPASVASPIAQTASRVGEDVGPLRMVARWDWTPGDPRLEAYQEVQRRYAALTSELGAPIDGLAPDAHRHFMAAQQRGDSAPGADR